jgi:hypothetical protein
VAGLTIPKDHQPLLNKIRTLPEESLEALVSTLEQSPADFPAAKGLSRDEAESIQDVLMELYRVRDFLDMEVPEFVSEIAASLQKVVGFPAAELPAFRERLARLLTIASVSISAKAESLKLEYERRFCSARILTDARPIYGIDPNQPPNAVMIMHTLRIAYHGDGPEMREFYVAMDDEDITSLRALLDRADIKAKSLKSLFASANVTIQVP